MASSVDVAKSLSDAQRNAIQCLPIWGFPVGHNAWPVMEYVTNDADEKLVCRGRDMEAVMRLGLAAADEHPDGEGWQFPEGDARWCINSTPLGLAVIAALAT